MSVQFSSVSDTIIPILNLEYNNMPQNTVNNKRIAKNTIFLYFRTFLVMLITLYTSRVVLRVLGETDYGIYNLIGGVVVFFGFMNTAMSSAVQRYLNFHLGRGETEDVQKVFSMSIVTHLIIVLCVIILGETLGLWFVETQLNIPDSRMEAGLWVYQFSLASCCINIIRIPYNAAIIAYEKMDFYAYLSIIEVLLKLGIVFLLTSCQFDALVVYTILLFGVSIIVFILYKIYCSRHFSTTKVIWFWNKSLFKKLMSFSGWSLFGSVANISVNQGLSILFNIFNGVKINAALGLAHQIQAALTSFISSFQTAFSPQIVKSYSAGEHSSFYNLLFRTSRMSYCLVFILAIPLIVCINPILKIWLVDVPHYTSQFAVVYIIYCMADALSGPLWVAVQATGDIKKYQIQISCLILLNLPLAYLVLVKGLSPVIALSFRAGFNIIAYIYRIVYLTKYVSFPGWLYVKNVTFPILIMTIISVPIALFLSRFTISNYQSLIVFITMMAINIVLVFALGIKRQERDYLMSMIKSKILKKI